MWTSGHYAMTEHFQKLEIVLQCVSIPNNTQLEAILLWQNLLKQHFPYFHLSKKHQYVTEAAYPFEIQYSIF